MKFDIKIMNLLADMMSVSLVVDEGDIIGSGTFTTPHGIEYELDIVSSYVNFLQGTMYDAGALCHVAGDLYVLVSAHKMKDRDNPKGTLHFLEGCNMTTHKLHKYATYGSIVSGFSKAIVKSFRINLKDMQWEEIGAKDSGQAYKHIL